MMHLSRFSEELILWQSWEFKFVELDDATKVKDGLIGVEAIQDSVESVLISAGYSEPQQHL